MVVAGRCAAARQLGREQARRQVLLLEITNQRLVESEREVMVKAHGTRLGVICDSIVRGRFYSGKKIPPLHSTLALVRCEEGGGILSPWPIYFFVRL